MKLDEAIKRAEEVAEKYKKRLKIYENIDEDRPLFAEEDMECRSCAEEHRQLAEWLCQLKQIQDIVQEYHDNYIEWGTGQSSVAFHKIVKIIEGGDAE